MCRSTWAARIGSAGTRLRIAGRAASEAPAEAIAPAVTAPPPAVAEAPAKAPAKHKLKREFEALPEEIERLEGEVVATSGRERPVFRDCAEAEADLAALADLQAMLEARIERWMELEAPATGRASAFGARLRLGKKGRGVHGERPYGAGLGSVSLWVLIPACASARNPWWWGRTSAMCPGSSRRGMDNT